MTASTTVDLDTLREQLQELLSTGRGDEAVAAVVELVGKLATENQRLAERVAGLMRGRAHGGSERIPEEQLALFLAQLGEPTTEDLEDGEADAELEDDDDAEVEDDAEEETSPKRKKKRKRVRVVGDVERTTQESDPSPEDLVCDECGEAKALVSQTRRVLVEVEPARFRIIDFLRNTYACTDCDDPHMVTGPSAQTPLESGVVTSSLLGDFLARKHADHEPVNRIAGTYRRMGIDFPLGTLYGWVGAGAEWLRPLAKRVEELALLALVLQVDDTGVDVLDRDSDGGTRRGHLWAMLGDERWAAFRFTPTWHAVHAEAFLGARKGWMQADAYPGYDRFYKRDRAIEVGCWSHARRYFVKALDGGDTRAARPLDIIRRIFKLESRATDKGWSDDRRLRARREKAAPLLNQLGRWVDSVHAQAPPDTALGRAITYLTNQWGALVQFLEDGRLRLTNNAAERQLRHIALGRNNWLFTGSDAGGERLAILYTLVATCKLAEVDPRAYLIDVLDKLCRGWPASRLDELLPPQWAEAQQAAKEMVADEVA